MFQTFAKIPIPGFIPHLFRSTPRIRAPPFYVCAVRGSAAFAACVATHSCSRYSHCRVARGRLRTCRACTAPFSLLALRLYTSYFHADWLSIPAGFSLRLRLFIRSSRAETCVLNRTFYLVPAVMRLPFWFGLGCWFRCCAGMDDASVCCFLFPDHAFLLPFCCVRLLLCRSVVLPATFAARRSAAPCPRTIFRFAFTLIAPAVTRARWFMTCRARRLPFYLPLTPVWLRCRWLPASQRTLRCGTSPTAALTILYHTRSLLVPVRSDTMIAWCRCWFHATLPL